MKNHLDAPSVCDGIEGAEGVAFRGASTTRGKTSTGKVETATVVQAAVAVGVAAVLSTEDDPARFKKLQAELDKLMEECAERAEQLVDSTRPKGEILDSARCNEVVGKDSDGKPVTRAMQLGTSKHEEAFKCVEKVLGNLVPGLFSLEQRYRYDRETGKLETVSKEEEQQLLRRGRKHELKGTIQPDVVVHSGNPLMVRIVYDFKFPCVKNTPPTWSIYTRPPYQDLTQGEVYKEAFKVTPARVSPGKKALRR